MKDSVFVFFGQTFLEEAALYLLSAAFVFYIVWHLGKKRFARYRVQKRQRADRKQFRREIIYSLLTILVGVLNIVPIIYLYRAGYTKITPHGASLGWLYICLNFVMVVLWNDTWFYWTHRLLHTKWMFNHIHHLHHQSLDSTPFTAFAFHPVEAFILSSGILPFVFLVPTHPLVLIVFQLYALEKNLEAHMGYEFLPAWFAKIAPFKYRATSTFHNLHHSNVKGNYSFYFRWWDRLFKTELAEYEKVFARISKD